jgi:hypothetical protein
MFLKIARTVLRLLRQEGLVFDIPGGMQGPAFEISNLKFENAANAVFAQLAENAGAVNCVRARRTDSSRRSRSQSNPVKVSQTNLTA